MPKNDKAPLGGLALLSFAVLLYELAQIRVFSYVLHPVVALSTIALAMLGFGLGATLVALRPGLARGDLNGRLARLCGGLAVVAVLVNVLFSLVAHRIVEPGTFEARPLMVAAVFLPAVAPYALAGLATALILDAHLERIGRFYLANLAGSAAGAALMIPLLGPLGAERLMILSAVLAAAAGVVVALGSTGAGRRRLAVALGALALALAALLPVARAVFPLQPDVTKYNTVFRNWEVRRGWAPPETEFVRWDPVGRLEVLRHSRPHVKVPEPVGYRVITVDGGAMTLMLENPGKPGWGSALFRDSIYAAAYPLLDRPRVLVIGPGGGADVEAALYWNARAVTGVEISGATVRALTGPYAGFAGWPERPEVHLVHTDGRAFAKSTPERFDLVQLSGVDTVTAHASGSMVTVEDYLYTEEAFTDFLGLLEPGGVLAVVRFGDEALNLSLIAVAALRHLGEPRPERCIAALRQAGLSGILVKRTPFTAGEIERLRRYEARELRARSDIPVYDVVGLDLGEPVALLHPAGTRPAPRYGAFFAAVGRGRELDPETRRKLGISFVVPTDDRPYYMLGMWANIVRASSAHPTLRLLLVASAVIGLASLALILLPVLALRRRGAAGPGPMAAVAVFFFGLGAGFMLLEVGLIHRAVVFVGTPGASVAVVLSSILVSSGLGAWFSDRLAVGPGKRLLAALAGVCGVGLAYHYGAGELFEALFGWPVWARCAAAAVAIAPAGFFMGWFFPAGMRVLGDGHRILVPWAIAVNGFASVLGSLATMFLGMSIGFGGVFAVALGCYALAVVAFLPLASLVPRSTRENNLC
jgi:SAM-dependent methyltransferase